VIDYIILLWIETTKNGGFKRGKDRKISLLITDNINIVKKKCILNVRRAIK